MSRVNVKQTANFHTQNHCGMHHISSKVEPILEFQYKSFSKDKHNGNVPFWECFCGIAFVGVSLWECLCRNVFVECLCWSVLVGISLMECLCGNDFVGHKCTS